MLVSIFRPDSLNVSVTKTIEGSYGVCNWLRSTNSPTGLCFSCEFNRTIPDLSRAKNIEKWRILEAAKKRLIYSLSQLAIHV